LNVIPKLYNSKRYSNQGVFEMNDKYWKLTFILIVSFLLDVLFVAAINNTVSLGWSSGIMIGIVVYVVMMAVLSYLLDKLT